MIHVFFQSKRLEKELVWQRQTTLEQSYHHEDNNSIKLQKLLMTKDFQLNISFKKEGKNIAYGIDFDEGFSEA